MFHPKTIYIQRSEEHSPIVRNVLGRMSGNSTLRWVDDADAVLAGFKNDHLPITEAKKILVLKPHKGAWLKPCPGMGGHVCCRYYVLYYGMGCSMDCAYCFLQNYLDTGAVVHYTNVEAMLPALRETLRARAAGGQPIRLGTGEFNDSLDLEHLTGFHDYLVENLKDRTGLFLEIKTKTTAVDFLLSKPWTALVTVAWSLNPENIQRSEEPGTAPLAERLAAAKKAVEAGYQAAFHFDPLIRHPGWEENYRRLVDQLYETIPREKITMISLGALRYNQGLEDICAERFPRSKIFLDEFVRGSDGKTRYFKPLRRELYQALLTYIRRHDPDPCIYMCMETPAMWQSVMGVEATTGKVADYLNRRYVSREHTDDTD